MQLKTSIVLVAALAAVGEASPFRFPLRRNAEESKSDVKYVTVHPVPLFPPGTGAPTAVPTATPTDPDTTPAPTTDIPVPTFPGTGAPNPQPSQTRPVSMETLTVTYTLGGGPSKTVVTRTVTRPCPETPQATAPEGGNGGGEPTTSATTTISTTSTTTKTVTLYPTDNAPGGEQGNGGNGGNGGATCVPVTVTVKETVTAKETVTVTAPSEPQPTDGEEPELPNLPPLPTLNEPPVITTIPTIPSPPYQNGTIPSTTVLPGTGSVTRTPLPTGY
ncbi:predicted protein [Uncinocarpus reesii 1704]|uniref:Uncharacterized protein n=1 Tax=Uncinocarpus reesii (strain UAMH 1704) TaxID=336963 RepID=C4JJU7_UNCRE|nr:uncharacterized protein UREG_01904 [Uncinocarpus reesii 1704]EEP77055.1 predicted protein [Uncinocarpus reesii 1704]